jgi:hypothetical protein
MKELFELEWMGGAAEHHFRKARPGIDDLPWGTIDTSDYAPDVLKAAQSTWTRSSLTEYRAVIGFSEVLRALCEAKAPVDIIGMASGFVADEVVHVELASKMAMELGGGIELVVDLDHLMRRSDPALTPLQRANDIVLRVSCVAEAFSGRMAVNAMRSTTHPLTKAVFGRIVADESLHYRLGGVYFEWAKDQLDDAERARLAKVALETIAPYATKRPRVGGAADATADGRARATIEQVQTIGWVEARLFGSQVKDAVQHIVAPLASYGIDVPAEPLAEMFG